MATSKKQVAGKAGKSARPAKAAKTAVEAGPVLQLKAAGVARQLTVRPDGVDFRDRMYVPTLVEVPVRRELKEYRKHGVPILDQGQEGACTGFGLATVAHYLLRTRKVVPDAAAVSPYMFYDMARRYDEWAGVDYEGSSCRGAVKGWNKHGVCAANLWKPGSKKSRTLTEAVAAEASVRPLGAYFRVNHTDLVAVHSAIAEVGILYASATVHAGWQSVGRDGHIKPSTEVLGGHAFAIVAYDEKGLWIQNSWGEDWGFDGFCHISYDDWLQNGTDVWVARLGAPVQLTASGARTAAGALPATSSGVSLTDIRPHVISIGNDGALDPRGDIGTTPETVNEILSSDFLRLTAGWKKKRLVLCAHGGLVSKSDALKTVDSYRRAMLDAECYPLAFIWKTDYFSTLANMLADASRKRRPEGILDSAKDFMLDRLDDTLEPIARIFTGKASWDEMRENALLATRSKQGGARLVADGLAKLAAQGVEIHLVAHSAGSIFFAALIEYLSGTLGVKLASCTLWAPAITTQLFKDCYVPALKAGTLAQLNLFTLTDQAERDDNCARIYNKSLLYLVSNAFEAKPRIPLIRPDGVPILGMAKFIDKDAELKALFKAGSKHSWVTAPNNAPLGDINASTARHHGDFDNDKATVQATLARITGKAAEPGTVSFAPSDYAVRRQLKAVANAGRE